MHNSVNDFSSIWNILWWYSVGLYRIYFFQSGRSRILPDLEWQIRPEPDFQIDCNFNNLMCKTLRTYEWFEFLIIFCAAVTVTTFLISGFITYLGLIKLLVPSYLMSRKNQLFKSSKTIRLRWDFLPEPDFCRIWKKCRIPAGAEIWYSPNIVCS